jgi:beta-mannosidase
MFACAMYPTHQKFFKSVKEEIKDQVIRLRGHPCIALWGGNNEIEEALVNGWYDVTKQNPYIYAVILISFS